jgi:hypothetical protein
MNVTTSLRALTAAILIEAIREQRLPDQGPVHQELTQ